LRSEAIPLIVCPLSNVKLRVFDTMANRNLGQLLELGLAATVNSDDPAHFGGYIADNFLAVHNALGLAREQYVTLAADAIEASFFDQVRKAAMGTELDVYMSS
jgi:adenosine deaminase